MLLLKINVTFYHCSKNMAGKYTVDRATVQYWSHVPKTEIEEKYTNNFCQSVQTQ